MNTRFTTLAGANISLDRFLDKNLNGNNLLFIGTDSKNAKVTRFSTVLASYTPGCGGVLIKQLNNERKIESLGERLMKEAWYSVQLAMEVAELVPLEAAAIEVHLDVSGNAVNKSASFSSAMIGFVSSQGFACRIKPDAWCATCLADKVIKRLGSPAGRRTK